MDIKCLKNSKVSFRTTDEPENFESHAQLFYGQTLHAQRVILDVKQS